MSGLGSREIALLFVRSSESFQGIGAVAIEGEGVLEFIYRFRILSGAVVDVTQAGMRFRQSRRLGQCLLATVGRFLHPVIPTIEFVKTAPVGFAQPSVGGPVIAVDCDGVIEFSNGAVDVFRFLVLLEISATAQVVLVGGGVGARVSGQRLFLSFRNTDLKNLQN